jgi:hypothetical protein
MGIFDFFNFHKENTMGDFSMSDFANLTKSFSFADLPNIMKEATAAFDHLLARIDKLEADVAAFVERNPVAGNSVAAALPAPVVAPVAEASAEPVAEVKPAEPVVEPVHTAEASDEQVAEAKPVETPAEAPHVTAPDPAAIQAWIADNPEAAKNLGFVK